VGFFLGVAGFVGHAVRLEVDWALLLICLAATVPAAWFGALLTGRLSARTVRRSVGAALLAVAAAIGVAALF
jgi:uncharacterized membrane protein YfcA